MKTKIFLTLIVSLFCNMALADFTILRPQDVVNADLTQAPSKACNSYQDNNQYTLTLTTKQKTWVKTFCSRDYFIWGELYSNIYKLMEGPQTPQCVLSEVCDRYTCSRVYGRTVVDLYDILLKTDAKGQLERHSVRLKTHCER